MNHKIDRDTYIIPPNFIESGTFFGGMFKARNVIEAGILAFAIGVPVFSLLPLGLTARIIALCLTALPAALVALIGVSGESLSSFLLIFIKYLRNRRIVGGNSAEDAVPATEHGGKHIKKKAHKPDKAPRRSRRSGREDFPAEFDEVRSYEIRQKLRPVKKQKPAKEKKAARQKKKVSKERKVKRPIRTQEPKPACLNPVADYLPISKIENGIIYTKDHRYVKVVEVVPINFMLRSAQEQRNIMFVALDFVWDRAKADRTEEKAIFIDECWQLLSGAGAAGVRLAGDFLLEIAKTIRGYGGASIFASQDLADFFDLDGGRFGKGIINNSKTKIILNLEDDEAQRVQEALHLSDAETMEITHFERGHGLISTNNNNIMVEFKASPLEKDLITTDRRELREIVERKRREQSTSAEQQI